MSYAVPRAVCCGWVAAGGYITIYTPPLLHTHTLSLTHTHTHTLSLSLTHTLSLSLTHTLSYTHTHTHTHILVPITGNRPQSTTRDKCQVLVRPTLISSPIHMFLSQSFCTSHIQLLFIMRSASL